MRTDKFQVWHVEHTHIAARAGSAAFFFIAENEHTHAHTHTHMGTERQAEDTQLAETQRMSVLKTAAAAERSRVEPRRNEANGESRRAEQQARARCCHRATHALPLTSTLALSSTATSVCRVRSETC